MKYSTLIILSCLAAGGAQATTVSYNEFVSGDLPYLYPNSTASVLNLGVGQNTVYGRLSSWGDFDTFAFSVPQSTQLNSVSLSFGLSTATGYFPSNQSATYGLSSGIGLPYAPYPNGNYAQTVNFSSTTPTTLFSLAAPLGAGTYTIGDFSHNDFSSGFVDYAYTLNVQSLVPLGPPQPARLTLDMFTASVGTSLGNVITTNQSFYSNNMNAAMDCASSVVGNCDPNAIYSSNERQNAQYSSDLAQLGVGTISTAQNVVIGLPVDTSIWDASTIGRIINFGEFIDTIKSSLTNSIDFFKSAFFQSSSQQLPAESNPDTVIINSITGSVQSGETDDLTWFLYNLNINADIAKDYFPDVASGQTFGSTAGLYPGSEAFGVFTVNDVVDPPGYNTTNLSMRQLEIVYHNHTVSEPFSITLFGIAILGLLVTRQRRNIYTRSIRNMLT